MPILGIIASGISGHLTPPWSPEGAYDALASVTLTSTANSILFSGIPANYKHLQIRLQTRNSANISGDDVTMRFNGDASSSYSIHRLFGNGATAGANSSSSASYIDIGYNVADASYPADIFSAIIVDILDYSNVSKNTTARTLYGSEANGSVAAPNQFVGMQSGAWYNTNAVNQIQIFPYNVGSNTFTVNTKAFLYGVK